MAKCYKGGKEISVVGSTDAEKETACTTLLGAWGGATTDTVCDINLINRYKQAEEENMLAYQRIIEESPADTAAKETQKTQLLPR